MPVLIASTDGSRPPGVSARAFQAAFRPAAAGGRLGSMRSAWCWALACLGWSLALSPAWAGTIRGTVRAQPKEGADADVSAGPYESRKFKFVERVNYGEMRDFVVYVDGPMAGPFAPPEQHPRIVQSNAVFTPHVLPVLVGTTVEWPNHDEILHNVFSYSTPKPFDLGLYKKETAKETAKAVTFDQPGLVDVFCSIHSKMHCIILVLPNPYFARTDARGSFLITNVPPGKVSLKAWHERLPPETNEVVVPLTGEVRVDFVLSVRNLPKY